METNSSLSLTNRRILVIFYLVTFLTSFLLIYLSEKERSSFMIAISLVLMIVNAVIGLYMKSTSEVFKIAKNEIALDERLTYVRLKAQRDAYFICLIIFMLMLPFGYRFITIYSFNSMAVILCTMGLLIHYLPTMIIAWQEKEV